LEGKTISHYRILEAIGRGGMGVVYKAEDLKLRRYAALKLLPQFLARDPQALQRFEREAQAASALNHPNICTVYEIDESDGLHFIAIELLEGETLKDRIKRGPLEVPEILGVVIEICDALEAAHSAGIIHRDIKPSNILVTRRGNAKLLDFGVAKRVGAELVRQSKDISALLPGTVDLRLTDPGAAIGTVAYMSPEQARGQGVDTRSDLFSLGAVLYEMTTGKYPFPGKDLADVLRAIQEQPPASIEQLNPKAPSELIRITKRAMQKDRSLRYQRAAEMQADLQTERTRLEARASKRKALLVLASVVMFFTLVVSASLRIAPLREWIANRLSGGVQREIKSLAVLPLENLTGDSSQDYFVDGMTDALITNLTKLGSVHVISRTSAMHYKGMHRALPEIARELNVNAVVEGSVTRSSKRFRISAELVDATSGRNLWARDYERDLQDVLQLQNELATAVAQEVAGKLTPQDQARLRNIRPVNAEAYEAYLKGRFYWSKRTVEALQTAKEYFEEATQKDPQYALAYAGLADAYDVLGSGVAAGLPPREAAHKAREAATKAIQIDETLAEGHTSLGGIKFSFDWDWEGAEREFRRAIELNPNDVTAHFWYAQLLLALARWDEALASVEWATHLDPVAPIIMEFRGAIFHNTRQYDKAIEQLQRTLSLDPNYFLVHYDLGRAYEQLGKYEEAIAEFQKALELSGGDLTTRASLAHVYAVSGRRARAERILNDLKQQAKGSNLTYQIADIYLGLRQKEEAFQWLEKAFEERSGWLTWTAIEPKLDPLRSDPRFADLLRRMRLSP
jgi:eukaryotic-like serine/threonine-protein kinase